MNTQFRKILKPFLLTNSALANKIGAKLSPAIARVGTVLARDAI